MTDGDVQNLLEAAGLNVTLQPGGRRAVSEVNIDLGISDGQLISQSKVGDEDGYTDPLAKLIVAVCEPLSITSNDEEFVPIGFFIVNKAIAKFDLEVSNESVLKPRFIVALDEISGVDTVSCFHAPPSGTSENLAWIAATTATLSLIESGTLTFADFLSNNGLAAGLNYALTTPFDVVSEELDNNTEETPNYLRQLGYLDHGGVSGINKIIDIGFGEDNLSDLSLLDGEGGPGGGRRAGVPTAVNTDGEVINLDDTIYDSALMFNQGSVTVYPQNLNIPQISPFSNTFFYRGSRNVTTLTNTTSSQTSVSSLPQLGDDDFIIPFPAGGNPLFGSTNIDLKRLHSFAEISSLLFFINNVNVEDRSFKTNANHDFGIIYYDQRGRHGFVNPLTTVFVPGYSNSERNGEPGSVTVNLPLSDLTPPDWAHNYKIAYARNTSVGNFVQYSSGGAFVQQIEDQEISQSNQNIYVSLNYLQEHPISYSSAFGARGLDGGMNLYKYQEGDRLRVISFDNGGGENREYVNSFEFEVVDYKLLSDTEDNPLSNEPDENQTGAFVVLKNNTSAFGFDYASVAALSDNWKKNCIIELYSPLKSAEEEDRIYYEIGETGSIEFNDDGVLTHNPATTSLTKGDVWFRKVPVNLREFSGGQFKDLIFQDNGEIGSPIPNFKSVYLETMSVSDLIRSNSHSIGRPNVASESAGEVIRESSLTYSDPTDPSSKKPKYSSFNLSQINFKDLLESYGDINYIANFGEFLVVLQKDKVSMVPVNRNILSDASGNQNVIASKEVLGSPVFMDNDNGSDSASSVVEVDSTLYFASAGSYAICKMSKSNRGVITISDKNVASLIRDEILLKQQETGAVRLVGGYDPVKEEYLITIINLAHQELSEIPQEIIQPGVPPAPSGPDAVSLLITDTNLDGVIDAEDLLSSGIGITQENLIAAGLIDPTLIAAEGDFIIPQDITVQGLIDAGVVTVDDLINSGLVVIEDLIDPNLIASEGDFIIPDPDGDGALSLSEFLNSQDLNDVAAISEYITNSQNSAALLASIFQDSSVDEEQFLTEAGIDIGTDISEITDIPDVNNDGFIDISDLFLSENVENLFENLINRIQTSYDPDNNTFNPEEDTDISVKLSTLFDLLLSLKTRGLDGGYSAGLATVMSDQNLDGTVGTGDLISFLSYFSANTFNLMGDDKI